MQKVKQFSTGKQRNIVWKCLHDTELHTVFDSNSCLMFKLSTACNCQLPSGKFVCKVDLYIAFTLYIPVTGQLPQNFKLPSYKFVCKVDLYNYSIHPYVLVTGQLPKNFQLPSYKFFGKVDLYIIAFTL